jgi:tetratricopeptide (TPR) repeat protein/purine-nucleoside phosphorylase
MDNIVFLFITANVHERDALLSVLNNKEIVQYKYGVMITYGDLGKYRIAHCHSAQGTKAEAEIKRAIQCTDADAVILVGIACGGIKSVTADIGNVLISKAVIDYDTHKIVPDKNEHRGDIFPAGSVLLRAFTNNAYAWSRETHIEHKIGQILSSTVHLNSKTAKIQIFGEFNDYPIGYEMEGASAVRACIDEHITELIIVKGISDLGCDINADDNDSKKTDYQKIASKNAVDICRYVFSNSDLTGIPKRQNNNSILSSNTPDLGNVIPVGREELLKKIELGFETNHIILLYGQGGIGKSISARYYANTHKRNYCLIRCMSFSNDIKQTLVMGCQLNVEHFSERLIDEQFHMIKTHLEKLTEKALIIIDINDENLSIINDYFNLPENNNIDILITSRKREILDSLELSVNELAYEQLKQIFLNNAKVYNLTSEDEDLLTGLITETFQFNTMVVALSARTLVKAHYSLIELSQLFEDDRLGQKINNISRDFKDRKPYDSKITEHVLRLFSVAKIADARYDILRYMSLISYDGIPFKKADEWFQLNKDFSNFNELIEGGWLQLSRESEMNAETVFMHPVISDAVFIQVRATSYNCHDLLDNIYNAENTEYDLHKKFYLINITDFIIHRLKVELTISLYHIYRFSVSLLYAAGNYETAFSRATVMLNEFTDVYNMEITEQIFINNTIGALYRKKVNYMNALDFHKKALSFCEHLGKRYNKHFVETMTNIGTVYFDAEDLTNAYFYFKRALKVSKKLYGKKHMETFTCYNNLANVYSAGGMFWLSIIYHKRLLAVKKKVIGEDSLSLAITYNNVGFIYFNRNKKDKAINCHLKALQIKEKALGESHPDTATSYGNVGVSYAEIGDHDKAIEYFMKEAEISKNVYGENHPATIHVYKNLALSFKNIGRKEKFEEYQRRIDAYESANQCKKTDELPSDFPIDYLFV